MEYYDDLCEDSDNVPDSKAVTDMMNLYHQQLTSVIPKRRKVHILPSSAYRRLQRRW